MPLQSGQQGILEVLDWRFSLLRLRVWVLFAPLTSASDCLVVTEGGTRTVGVGWVRLLLAAALFALLTSAFDCLVVTEGSTRAVGVGLVRLLLASALAPFSLPFSLPLFVFLLFAFGVEVDISNSNSNLPEKRSAAKIKKYYLEFYKENF